MKYSISNIAWNNSDDDSIYQFLKENKFEGIEIAPTRIFPESPYDHKKEAKLFAKRLFEQYGLYISSMQSIWYGRKEQIFEHKKQRQSLIEYTKKAFEFANQIKCRNLVFGCPKNRNMKKSNDISIAIEFFGKLGELAIENDVVLALEANPEIYGTNFLNMTDEAINFIKEIDSAGIQLNYDLGTAISNGEKIESVKEYISYINHVHISRPNLNEVYIDGVEKALIKILHDENYEKYISIEMKNINNIDQVKKKIKQIKSYGRLMEAL